MSIGDYCRGTPTVVRPEETLRTAARRMAEDGVGCLVVVDEARHPVGMVTDRDVVVQGLRRRLDLDTTPVSEIMARDVTTVPAFLEREVAIRRLRAEGVRRLPVVDETRRLVGVFAIDDALQAFAECAGAVAAVARSQFPEPAPPKGA